MMIKPEISRYSVPARIAILIVIMVISMILFTFLGMVSGIFIFHLSPADLVSGQTLIPSAKNADILKYFQLVDQIGLFVIPALLFAYFSRPVKADFLQIKIGVPVLSLVLAGLILFAGLPLIDKLLQWNEAMKLPAVLKGIEDWMKASESSAGLITDLFLKTGSWQGLAANLLIMAIIPAIGEEFIFRGVLLNLLSEWTKKKYLGILLSAAVFSAIHMQFYGFLPRFVLGIYLGYLFVRSGSIWVPVFAHFVNNAITVIVAFLFFKGSVSINYEKFGSTDNWIIFTASLILTSGLILVFNRIRFTSLRSAEK